MSMPSARGLFHRVMTMSGQQLTATVPEHASATAEAVLKALNLTPSKLEAIRDPSKVPMEKLVASIRAGNYFGPVHDDRTLPHDPFSPGAPAISADIPMILGNTHDETRLLIGASNPALFSLTWEQLPAELEHYRQFLGTLTTADIIADYRKWYPAYSPSDVFFAVTTAFRSWRGMVIESERRAAQHGPTWVYNFTWKSPADGGKWGAPHTIDIPFAFDNLSRAAPTVSADGVHPSSEAQQLAAQYADTLINFARTGDPNHPGLPHWAPLRPHQPPYHALGQPHPRRERPQRQRTQTHRTSSLHPARNLKVAVPLLVCYPVGICCGSCRCLSGCHPIGICCFESYHSCSKPKESQPT